MEIHEISADVETLQQAMLRLSWVERRRQARRLEAFHLTTPQYMALRALDRQVADGMKMGELAEAAYQVSATMTGIIDRLEEGGLVVRQRDPDDRRAQLVRLTDQGRTILAEIDRLNRLRLERVLQKLTKDERSAILTLIEHYLAISLSEADNP
jgi:MarR family transcriptional regulator, organic hydroperoxide resistance regulator